MNVYPAILLFVLCTIISSFSQILLKLGARKGYEGIRTYLNIYVISGYAVFFFVTLVTIFCYKYVDLSLGGLISALSYAFVAILSRIILKEKIDKRQITAILLIIAGVSFSVLM